MLIDYIVQILRRCGSSVELVDVSDKLPELIRRPGLKKWKVNEMSMCIIISNVSVCSCLYMWGDSGA